MKPTRRPFCSIASIRFAMVCAAALFLCVAAARAGADDIDALIGKVRDKTNVWNVRRNSAVELLRRGDRRAVPLFSEILDDADENPNMVDLACRAMGKFKVTEKVPRLVKIMEKVRNSEASFALAQIKDPRVIGALCGRVVDGPRALHYYVTRTDPGNREPVEYLKTVVRSGSPGSLAVPLATLETLIGEDEAAKFIPKEHDLVVTVDRETYRREIPAPKIAMTITVKNVSDKPLLIGFGMSPSLCMVERRFRDFHEDPWCIEVLSASKALKALPPMKRHGEGGGRWESLRIEPAEAIDLNCRFFHSSGGFGLGPDGEYVVPNDPEARVKILYRAADGRELKMCYSRKFSFITRERKAGKDDLPALHAALRDTDPDVRRGVIFYLQDVGAPATTLLIGALKDEDRHVRLAAVNVLAHVGPRAKETVGPLAQALKDVDPSVRSHAAEALGGIGPAALDAAPALLEALMDKEPSVRWNAARTLGTLGATQAETAVAKLLQDENGEVRSIATKALEQIRSAREKSVKPR